MPIRVRLHTLGLLEDIPLHQVKPWYTQGLATNVQSMYSNIKLFTTLTCINKAKFVLFTALT